MIDDFWIFYLEFFPSISIAIERHKELVGDVSTLIVDYARKVTTRRPVKSPATPG